MRSTQDPPTRGATVDLGRTTVFTGTCSWTDKTLTHETDWYPKRSMSAADRLRFYAGHFPITEVDATYYWPPRTDQAAQWAARTPDGFRMDVKAYSLLTGHPTRPDSLWPDVRERLLPDAEGKPRVYATHLEPDALDEAWRRFDEALRPLHEAGKLGAVLFQYPPWFTPRRDNRAQVAALRERLPDYRVCVEFRSPRWLAEPGDADRTLRLLADAELAMVCVDAPEVSGLPRRFDVTTEDLAVARFHGRADETWADTSGSAAERFKYPYSDGELAELATGAARLADQAREVHLLMNNCYRDFGVRNAARLRELLVEAPQA